ncbi:MAG: hypothetical protein HZB41_10425 [Ignavibacteriae bacterium]|nr:hypothetical protein [Ignavibacteriota bacterium]
MDYSRMIHDYLDGELGQMEQDILFAELATNQDLRFDFNQQVKLQVIAQSDMALITPPLEATNAIFSTLGFSIPSEEYLNNLVGDTVATSPISSIKRFWVKHFALNVIVLLLLLTSGTMLVLNPDMLSTKGNSGKTIASQNQNSNLADRNNLSGMTSIPIVSSFESTNNNDRNPAENNNSVTMNQRSSSHQNRIAGNNAFSFDEQSNSAISNSVVNGADLNTDRLNGNNKIFADNELISDASQDMSMTYLANRRVNSSLSSNSNVFVNPSQSKSDLFNINLISGYFDNPFSAVSIDNSNWTIQVRKLSLTPYQKTDLSQTFDKKETPSWNSNLTFAALYKVNPYLSFGVEIGWESFSQIFTYKVDGQNKSYQQNPMLMWYGLTGKYNMREFILEDVVYPYVQFTGAGSSSGAVLRAQTGLMFIPVSLIRFNVGYEAACLLYNVDRNLYGSGNYGFTFGGSVNF